MSEEIAVHCKTKEEWDAAQEKALKQAPWTGGEKSIPYDPTWPYFYFREDELWIASSENEVENNTIIPASEYLNREEEEETFKVGDRVECIKEGCGGKLRIGEIYIVSGGLKGGQIKIQGNTFSGWWPEAHKFRLVKSTKQPNKPIKEESNMNKNIATVYAGNTVTEGNLVEKHFSGSRGAEFIAGLVMKKFSKEILAEAKRLEAEEVAAAKN